MGTPKESVFSRNSLTGRWPERIIVNLLYCDHGHATIAEIRILPMGECANLHVCQIHYHRELAFRRDSGSWDITDGTQFPAWELLALCKEDV